VVVAVRHLLPDDGVERPPRRRHAPRVQQRVDANVYLPPFVKRQFVVPLLPRREGHDVGGGGVLADVIAAVVLLGRMVTGYRGAQRPLDVYLGYGGGIVIVVRMRIGWLGFVVVVTMMIGMMIHSSVCGVCLFPYPR
jgi:hypothetical protein